MEEPRTVHPCTFWSETVLVLLGLPASSTVFSFFLSFLQTYIYTSYWKKVSLREILNFHYTDFLHSTEYAFVPPSSFLLSLNLPSSSLVFPHFPLLDASVSVSYTPYLQLPFLVVFLEPSQTLVCAPSVKSNLNFFPHSIWLFFFSLHF